MKFKKLLKEKDIRASQLARRLGVSVGVVWKWCNDKCKPDIGYVIPIANILAVSEKAVLACWEN